MTETIETKIPSAIGSAGKKAKNGFLIRTTGDEEVKLICTGPIEITPIQVFDGATRKYLDEHKTDELGRVLWRAKSGLIFSDRSNVFEGDVSITFATEPGDTERLVEIGDSRMGQLVDLDGAEISYRIWLFRGNDKEKPSQGCAITIAV